MILIVYKLILTKFKRIDKNSLSNISPFKQIHDKSPTWKKKKTSEIGKKYFVECHAPRLKDGIFATTNSIVELNDPF